MMTSSENWAKVGASVKTGRLPNRAVNTPQLLPEPNRPQVGQRGHRRLVHVLAKARERLGRELLVEPPVLGAWQPEVQALEEGKPQDERADRQGRLEEGNVRERAGIKGMPHGGNRPVHGSRREHELGRQCDVHALEANRERV